MTTVDTPTRAADQRYLDALNRARLTKTRRLRRRERALRRAYRSSATSSVLLDLAATILVLRERGWRVQADETTDLVLEALMVISVRYRDRGDPDQSRGTLAANETGTP